MYTWYNASRLHFIGHIYELDNSKFRNGSRLASIQAQGFIICCASYLQSWNNRRYNNSIQNRFMAGLIESLHEVSRWNLKSQQSTFHRQQDCWSVCFILVTFAKISKLILYCFRYRFFESINSHFCTKTHIVYDVNLRLHQAV
jgi:hypothetical protein